MSKVTIKLHRQNVKILMYIIESFQHDQYMKFPSYSYMFMIAELIRGLYIKLNSKVVKMAGNDSYNMKVNRGEAAALWELCKAAKDEYIEHRLLMIDIMAKIDKRWSFKKLEDEQKQQNTANAK